MHLTSNANLCTLKKVAKNNDRAAVAANVVALGSRARARAHTNRSCDSFNQLAKNSLLVL